jgi:pyruvate/2-oxoacid:ferredoxin oxidoreductase alpha subunit
MSITKNENGTLSIGADIQIVSSYNKETKQHTFNLLKTGRVPVIHIGNHLTLRNTLSKLVAELEAATGAETVEVASEVASEAILESLTFEHIEADENAPTSESEEYNMFKDYLKKFSEATGEERENFAEIASQILLGMNLQAV